MRVRWRGLELPSRLICDKETITPSYGRFAAEPFERGFGHTIGNSLRRILLSSLEGAAVTQIKVDKASHEFATIDGVKEDVTDLILNIKGVVVRMTTEEPSVMRIQKQGAGKVKAGDLITDPAVQVMNTEHHIATLSEGAELSAELVVKKSVRFCACATASKTPAWGSERIMTGSFWRFGRTRASTLKWRWLKLRR